MTKPPRIPDDEFVQRTRTVQRLMQAAEVDILLAFANEAEPQFVRYLGDYWPSFETAAVVLGTEGDPILIIGPESLAYATDRSRIPDIRRVQSFRESSNPEYPGVHLDSLSEVIAQVSHGAPVRKAAIAGYNLVSHLVYSDYEQSLQQFGCTRIVNGDFKALRLSYSVVISTSVLSEKPASNCT